jgi:hypothetical protein
MHPHVEEFVSLNEKKVQPHEEEMLNVSLFIAILLRWLGRSSAESDTLCP